MTIRMVLADEQERKVKNVQKYDFYPETKIIFADCGDAVYYIPMNDKLIIEIYGGTERGYLEGHDEAC